MQNPETLIKLTRYDINALKNAGHDPNAIKGGKRASRFELVKDHKGDVFIVRRCKRGEAQKLGEPTETGLNLKHLREALL